MKPPRQAAALEAGMLEDQALVLRGPALSRSVDAGAAEGHHALVQNAQRGDKKAFAALVEVYQHTVYGFLRARLLETADARFHIIRNCRPACGVGA